MGTIVVGVDGSEQAQTALEWALEEAKLRNAEVAVVHSYDPNMIELYSWPGATASQLQAMRENAAEEAEALLSEIVGKAGDLAEGVTVTAEAARGQTPAWTLIERSKAAEMIVVGSRGRGGFRGMLLGSVSQQVAQHAECPVVVISGRG